MQKVIIGVKHMNKVDVNGLTEQEFLAEYKPGDYDRPSVTVDMMVLRMKEGFLGRQGAQRVS